MTQWVENPSTGRERGPRGILRAWVELLVRPRRFFARGVAPGDQGPGITFAILVVLIAEGSRILAFGGGFPVLGGQPVASGIVWVLLLGVLVVPAGVHLIAALQTVILAVADEGAGGVSETVQVICYAVAPAVFLGIPNVWVRSLLVLWGGALLVVGMAVVHDIRIRRAVPIAAVPAVFVFGWGFDGTAALAESADVGWVLLRDLLG